MNTFQTLKDVNPDIEHLLPTSLNGFQRSTLWIGNTEETPIAAINIHETEVDFILKVRIPDIDLFKLELQVTPETILIQGQSTEAAGVEGYFRPSGFESLIPLPHAVQPESCWTQKQPEALTIQLSKELKIPPPKVLIQLPTANSSAQKSS